MHDEPATHERALATGAPAGDWSDWSAFIENVEDYAVYMLDAEGRVATWNRGAQKLKGYTAQEIIGAHFSAFYPPEEVRAGRPERVLAEAAREGRAQDEGFRVRKDGTLFWASVVVTAFKDERGRVVGYTKITRDLTERRENEEKLRHSEERLRMLVETIRDYAIFMLDADGNIVTWNGGAVAILGYTADEVIGRPLDALYPEEELAAQRSMLERASRDGRVEARGFRVRKDGSRFWANTITTPLRDREGVLQGYAMVTRDLTGDREAEAELRRSEERFRLLVSSVVDYAMYMLDPSGRVTTWNAGAEKLKGYRSEEIVGRHFATFFREEDVAAGKPERELEVARTTGHFEEEGFRVRKDGSTFWANVTLTPILDERGTLLGFAKVTRDLTQRVEAERIARELFREQAAREAAEATEWKLREAAQVAANAAQRAEEANRVKDEFLATVSHELRTPLNAIVGWSSLLLARAPEPSLARGLSVIHRNAVAQARIIDDILDVSRIITGKLRLDVKPTDLVAIVQEAVEGARPAAAAKQLELDFDVPAHECWLLADADRVRQIVWNLLSNATKFTDPGGAIRITIEARGASYALSVSDTGCGISSDFLPYVFDRFKQADGTATRRVGGLGLGLAIVRHLAELHGGEVRAESRGVGQGSTFTVTLPIRAVLEPFLPDSERDDSLTPSEGRSIAPEALFAHRVLVVDDEEDARELLAQVLTEAGAVVQTAGSAAEAYDVLQRFRPQVLVSDIGMPNEDGYSLIRRVRALDARTGGTIPALALTAYARDEDRAKAIATGYTAHLAKPVNASEFLRAVAKLSAASPS